MNDHNTSISVIKTSCSSRTNSRENLSYLIKYYVRCDKYLIAFQMNCTCKPAFIVAIFSVFYPHFVPGVGKVDEENKLDDNEDERADHSKVKPH